jgi:sterol 3beta-glucosyltransferase
MALRIGIQTWGTEGDVRPFFALAQALAIRGHRVRLNYTSVEGRLFDALAKGCGIEARSVGGEYFVTHREEVQRRMSEIFALGNPLQQIRGIFEASMDPVVDAMFDAASELAEDSDAVVGHFLTHPAGAAAAKYGKPYTMVTLQPVMPSAHYAPVGMPDLGRFLNPLLWKILGRVLESVLRDRVNHVRDRACVPPVRGLLGATLDHAILVLTAVSPTLFPRPKDWDERIQVSGFLGITDSSEPWEPDPALRAFLDAGVPPVFLSFGSMLTFARDNAAEAVTIMKSALRLSGARGIIQAPEALVSGLASDETAHFIARAPHAKLFPLCSLVVHHGGAGTTQSAVSAGRPSVVVPHAADQFFWGDRLHALGLAAKPLKRTSLTEGALGKRLSQALSDPGMRTRAEEVAKGIRLEDGPARAAELIEQALGVEAK